MNEYLKFYEKYKISPVVQNIENFNEHVKRRSNLYRQLSVLPLTIKDKDILEIGPGGGYNALATYTFEPNSYTLVEPNTTGYNELIENFKTAESRTELSFFNCMLEDFKVDKKFDIIFCEGLIQGLNNKEEFINSLDALLKPNGILVITCSDEISVFFEIVRRHIANIFTRDINDFNKKTELLMEIFSKDLSLLKGMTRKHEDWCNDLMCDAYYEHRFSINDIFDIVQEKYYFIGSSPHIFQDTRWYKSLPTDPSLYNKVYYEQFKELRHSLIYSHLEYSKRDPNLNVQLSNLCNQFIDMVKAFDKNESRYEQEEFVQIVKKISLNLKGIDKQIDSVLIEIQELFIKKIILLEDIKNLQFLPNFFGKGQIFVSLTKDVS